MIIGYERTSTLEQQAGFDAQVRDLMAAGAERVFQEQVSSVAARAQLEAALDFVRGGDVFMVTKLDRLARSVPHLFQIVERLAIKRVALRILAIGLDSTTPTGKLMLTMLGAVAAFEREMMLERQREGIAKARAEGKYKGRAPTAQRQVADVLRLAADGRLSHAQNGSSPSAPRSCIHASSRAGIPACLSPDRYTTAPVFSARRPSELPKTGSPEAIDMARSNPTKVLPDFKTATNATFSRW
jgi:DNA invertase Pin-like site-specific DNA recombinase